MRDYLMKNKPIRFQFPIDGDCINSNDGTVTENGIMIQVTVEAPEGHTVEICGAPAQFQDGAYRAEVLISDHETVLYAQDKTAGTDCRITVFRLKNPLGGYRLSSDDNILFLSDITDHKDVYTSIFDNPYLALYKKAHDLYGAKVHLNLFYEFDSNHPNFVPGSHKYFNLSMMTDKFREDFQANANWLKFSFHAKADLPGRPYTNADAPTALAHMEQVVREVVRFAGPETLSACTTLHWGSGNKEVVSALRKQGYRVFAGYFHPTGEPVAYYAPPELVEHVYHRDFWKDTETDVFFSRIDRVINIRTLAENMEVLKQTVASPTRGGFVSIMIHEQYFYPTYKGYLPDFEKRVLEACKYLKERGYQGRLLQEVDDFGNLPV
jgi:hypothetical protein